MPWWGWVFAALLIIPNIGMLLVEVSHHRQQKRRFEDERQDYIDSELRCIARANEILERLEPK